MTETLEASTHLSPVYLPQANGTDSHDFLSYLNSDNNKDDDEYANEDSKMDSDIRVWRQGDRFVSGTQEEAMEYERNKHIEIEKKMCDELSELLIGLEFELVDDDESGTETPKQEGNKLRVLKRRNSSFSSLGSGKSSNQTYHMGNLNFEEKKRNGLLCQIKSKIKFSRKSVVKKLLMFRRKKKRKKHKITNMHDYFNKRDDETSCDCEE